MFSTSFTFTFISPFLLFSSTGSFFSWCAVLPAMMKPGNNIIKQLRFHRKRNYFFSWGAFFMAMSILWDTYTTLTAMTRTVWGALMAASFVTMASGA
jgi:hypothetical protein